MDTRQKLLSEARKQKTIAINKLYRSLMRIIEKANLSGKDLNAIADVVSISREVMNGLKRNKIDDMTLTDYFRIRELLYGTSLTGIYNLCNYDYHDLYDDDFEDYGEDDENDEEREFLIDVNKTLPDNSKVNVDEALDAKECADEDMGEDYDEDDDEEEDIIGSANINGKKFNITPENLNEVLDELNKVLKSDGFTKDISKLIKNNLNQEVEKKSPITQEDIKEKYDKAVKEAQIELFDDIELLDNKSLGDLKYYIYKNHWENEFDLSLINHRQSVLLFLYRKLQELTEKKQKQANHLTEEDEKNFNNIKKKADEYAKKNMPKINPENPLNSFYDFVKGFGLTY